MLQSDLPVDNQLAASDVNVVPAATGNVFAIDSL